MGGGGGDPETMVVRYCAAPGCGKRIRTPCRMEGGKYYHPACYDKLNSVYAGKGD